jgi:hypothetical protein
VNATFSVERSPGSIDVLCECGDADCLERVEVPLAIYEEVRQDEDYFLVTPGHENGELVLAADQTYRIVLLQGVMPALMQKAS